MWPTGWCGGRCSSSGTWRCTRVMADTPWKALEGAGVWRTAPGRRPPHAEVERAWNGHFLLQLTYLCNSYCHAASQLLNSSLTYCCLRNRDLNLWRSLTRLCLHSGCMGTVYGSGRSRFAGRISYLSLHHDRWCSALTARPEVYVQILSEAWIQEEKPHP